MRCRLKSIGVTHVLATALLLAPLAGLSQSLPELMEGVLSTHPTLRSQRALGESAKQGVEAAQWQFYPTPSIAFEQVDAGPQDQSYPPTGDKNTTTLRLQQPLWTGGRLTAGLDKAQAAEKVSLATLQVTRQELALRVVQLYAEWYGARLKREAYDKSAQAHQRLQEQIVRRISGGVSPPSDLTLLLGRAQQTDADLAATAAQEHSALVRLSQLYGRPLQAQALAAALSAPQPLDAEVASLLDYAMTQSPSVLKLQAQALISEAEITERKAETMPEAYLRAERQYGSFSTAGLGPQNRFFLGFSSRLGAGLSSFSQVAGAQARYEAALADVESSRLSIGEQLQADFAQATAGDSRLRALMASLDSSDRITRAWNRQFVAGRKTWLDVMNAVRELAQLEAQIADARAQQLLLSWRLTINGRGLDTALNPGAMVPSPPLARNASSGPEDMADALTPPISEDAALELRLSVELSLPKSRTASDTPRGVSENTSAQLLERTW